MEFLLKFALILAISAVALGAASPKSKCDIAACNFDCPYGFCVYNPYAERCYCDYGNDPDCRNNDNCDGDVCNNSQICVDDGYRNCYCAYLIKTEKEPAAAVADEQQ